MISGFRLIPPTSAKSVVSFAAQKRSTEPSRVDIGCEALAQKGKSTCRKSFHSVPLQSSQLSFI
jgi:hypothetical protein